MREFDEKFKDFNGISKRIADNNSTWTDAECKDIKEFIASRLTLQRKEMREMEWRQSNIN